MASNKSRTRIWLTIGLILIITLLLIYFVDLEELILIFTNTNWRFMLIGSIALMLGYLLISIRWRYLLANKPTFLQVFHGDSIGYMVTMLSPIPAPALRVVTLSSISSLSTSYVTSGMVVETLLGVVMRILALAATFLLTTKITESIGSILFGFALIVATFVGIIILARNSEWAVDKIGKWLSKIPRLNQDRVQGSLIKLKDGLNEAGSPRKLTVGMFYSILMWALFLVFFYLAWLALPVELSNSDMLTLSFASLVLVPPSAPAMPGIYQGVLVGSLALLKITDVTVLIAYAILVYLVQFVFWMVLGAWALLRTDLKLGELITGSREFLQAGPQVDESDTAV